MVACGDAVRRCQVLGWKQRGGGWPMLLTALSIAVGNNNRKVKMDLDSIIPRVPVAHHFSFKFYARVTLTFVKIGKVKVSLALSLGQCHYYHQKCVGETW